MDHHRLCCMECRHRTTEQFRSQRVSSNMILESNDKSHPRERLSILEILSLLRAHYRWANWNLERPTYEVTIRVVTG